MLLFSWLPWKKNFWSLFFKNVGCGRDTAQKLKFYMQDFFSKCVQVILENYKLSIDLYVRETDSHQ